MNTQVRFTVVCVSFVAPADSIMPVSLSARAFIGHSHGFLTEP